MDIQQTILYITFITLTSLIMPRAAIFFPDVYPLLKFASTTSKNAGNPLMISRYLENDSITLAQNLSKVSLTDKLGLQSHAGFLTIDENYNSNLYFWYFVSSSNIDSAPLILWLQGGPGGSSLYGLFMEIGPLIATKDGFALRKYHWGIDFHLLFIDNPVGAGFSFTVDNNGYCTDSKAVAKGLYKGLVQFFQLFPNLKYNELYIAGESYAGKYLPELAMKIHQENVNSLEVINLKGVAMGNPYCDPINQLDYGHYLHQHGLIDDEQLEFFLRYQANIAKEIQAKHWANADVLLDRLIDGRKTNFSYFRKFTGFDNYYDYLEATSNVNKNEFIDLLQQNSIRRSIHVGGLPFNDGSTVQLYLALDGLKSVAPIISELLSHYPIMFYSGQRDLILPYPLTTNVLRNLKYPNSEQFKKAPREIWRVDDDIAGYWKKAGNLTDVLVRNAGHMVPKDQPKWALDMIRKFIFTKDSDER